MRYNIYFPNDAYTKNNYWRKRFSIGPNGKKVFPSLYWFYNYWYPYIGKNGGYMRKGLYMGRTSNYKNNNRYKYKK